MKFLILSLIILSCVPENGYRTTEENPNFFCKPVSFSNSVQKTYHRVFECKYKGIKYLKDCTYFDSCSAIRLK